MSSGNDSAGWGTPAPAPSPGAGYMPTAADRLLDNPFRTLPVQQAARYAPAQRATLPALPPGTTMRERLYGQGGALLVHPEPDRDRWFAEEQFRRQLEDRPAPLGHSPAYRGREGIPSRESFDRAYATLVEQHSAFVEVSTGLNRSGALANGPAAATERADGRQTPASTAPGRWTQAAPVVAAVAAPAVGPAAAAAVAAAPAVTGRLRQTWNRLTGRDGAAPSTGSAPSPAAGATPTSTPAAVHPAPAAAPEWGPSPTAAQSAPTVPEKLPPEWARTAGNSVAPPAAAAWRSAATPAYGSTEQAEAVRLLGATFGAQPGARPASTADTSPPAHLRPGRAQGLGRDGGLGR